MRATNVVKYTKSVIELCATVKMNGYDTDNWEIDPLWKYYIAYRKCIAHRGNNWDILRTQITNWCACFEVDLRFRTRKRFSANVLLNYIFRMKASSETRLVEGTHGCGIRYRYSRISAEKKSQWQKVRYLLLKAFSMTEITSDGLWSDPELDAGAPTRLRPNDWLSPMNCSVFLKDDVCSGN